MKFKVPKFLDRETRIFSFLTFKQLALVGIGVIIIIILYYTVSKGVFFILTFIIIAIVISLLFVRVQGVPLGQIVTQSIGFMFGSKKYMWKKQENLTPIKIVKRQEEKKEEEQAPLKVAPESKLGKLSSKIDFGI